MSALAFRNVDVSPDDPVASWPQEAIQTALERGGLKAWGRIVEEIRSDPWGRVARGVEEVLTYSRPYGVAELMERVVADARAAAEESERAAVATEVKSLISRSDLSRAEFASRIGTSTSRLSTYATGKVMPSAALLVRMHRIAPDPHDVALVETMPRLTPEERLLALGRYACLRQATDDRA